MAIWEVRMERDMTRTGRVTVEAESAEAAERAAYEFLENGGGDDYDHSVSDYGDYAMSSSPADEQEQPEIRATDTEGGYEKVNEDEQ
jgi:hypothetical protein